MKAHKISILFAVLTLIVATLACAGGELGLSNFRVAFDEKGESPTSTYGTTDAFHAVADLSNAPIGTTASAKWYSINAEGFDPNAMINETSLTIDQDGVDYVTFQLTNEAPWGAGDYKVEFYLNGALVGTVNFNVQ